MTNLREYVEEIVDIMTEPENVYEYAAHAERDSSYFRKPRPDVLVPGQVWRARLLRQWTEGNPHQDFLFVLTYVSEQQDHCKGFLLFDGGEGIFQLADATDVAIPYHESPINAAVIMTWRGEVNLVPGHLKWYYGDVTEVQLREAMDKYVPVITQQAEEPALNPELQPIRDLLWKLTEEFDGEAIDKVLQD